MKRSETGNAESEESDCSRGTGHADSFRMLFDKAGKLRELYLYRNPMPPEELLNISRHELELSREQSFITMRGEQPYVISAEYIGDFENSAMLLIASPID